MAKNDIGGFFVSLGLNPDKNSFETGNKLIDGVTTGLNKLIGTARNAAVVLTTTAVATGAIESAGYKTATVLGMSTRALDVWKASAKIAGVNAEGLVSALGKIGNIKNHLKIDGSGVSEFSEQLAKLGLGYEKIKDLTTDEAFKTIINQAHNMLEGTDMSQVAAILNDVLGSDAMNFFIELERQGKTIDEFLTGASRTVFTTDASNQKAADFASEVNTLKAEIQSITKLLGSEVGGVMTPYIKSLNDWIQDHGKEIQDAIKKVAEITEKILGKLEPYLANSSQMIFGLATGDMDMASEAGKKLGLQLAADLTGNDVNDVASGFDARTNAINAINEYKLKKGYKPNDWIPYAELPANLQKEFDKYAEKSWGRYRFGGAIKDGIIRPNGQITQVAPDDWVIAARNLGDMARAFIPQSTMAGVSNEYTISQTFNINGSNDIPQVIRQQAYRGTQEGLLALMDQSSRRLQMMSGTR
jgi:hypothetical protein